jgi:excisionase family DNA binding protein
MIRNAEQLILGADGPGVYLSARVCAYLNRHAGLEQFRLSNRGIDPEVDAALVAIRLLELHFRNSATGTKEAAKPELAASSKWLSTTETADRLGITDRGVRTAIADGRLKAENIAGRWRINLENLEHFKALRSNT